ncbi:FixH family protein [Elioraea sp.]|uniref:FixH family protein n=1 Tax=Elioraea sp. TaxID=2185103 RepID=UPI0025BEA317|nr:FixH family protein [Elioraea sp.]
MSSAVPRPGRDGWIPWVFVGCMTVVVIVNAIMAWFALSTFAGTTVDRSYERGRQYNAVIAEAERQARTGWNFSVAWHPGTGDPLSGTVVVTARDAAAAPLDRLSVEAVLLRPLEAPQPLALAFSEVGPGLYAAPVTLPRPGQWEVRMKTRRGQGGGQGGGQEGPVDYRQRFVAR